MGWPAIENGKLLTLAAQSLTFLSQLIETLLFNRTYRVSTWQLWSFAPTNRLEDLRALAPKLLQALPTAKRGEAIRVST